MEYGWSILQNTWLILVESAPWLLVGFLLGGVIHALVPERWIARQLGQPGFGGVAKASLVGIPLSLCSCSVIPVASSLRKSGASRGATAGFLISTPEIGAEAFALSYALLGPILAFTRPIVALITALTAGGLIEWFGKPKSLPHTTALPVQETNTSCCETTPSCCGESAPIKKVRWWKQALQYGYLDMFKDLSRWLMIGFILAGVVASLIPTGFLESHMGGGILPMLLMAAVGLPLYICATSSTPLAAMLIAKGLSPGAALVLLMVGPATNIATIMVVGKDLGRKGLVIYLLTITVISIGSGLAFDQFLSSYVATPSEITHEHHAVGVLSAGAAVVLVALMLNGLRLRYKSRPPHESKSALPKQPADECH